MFKGTISPYGQFVASQVEDFQSASTGQNRISGAGSAQSMHPLSTGSVHLIHPLILSEDAADPRLSCPLGLSTLLAPSPGRGMVVEGKDLSVAASPPSVDLKTSRSKLATADGKSEYKLIAATQSSNGTIRSENAKNGLSSKEELGKYGLNAKSWHWPPRENREINPCGPFISNKKRYIGTGLEDNPKTQNPWPIEKDGGLEILFLLMGHLFDLKTDIRNGHGDGPHDFEFLALDAEKRKEPQSSLDGRVTLSDIGFAKMKTGDLASYLRRGERVETEHQEGVFSNLYHIAEISHRPDSESIRSPWASSVSLNIDVRRWDPRRIVFDAMGLRGDGTTPKEILPRTPRRIVLVGHSIKFDIAQIRDTKGSTAPRVNIVEDPAVLGVIDTYEMAMWLDKYGDLEILKAIRLGEKKEFTPALNVLMKVCGIKWQHAQLHRPGHDAVFSLKVALMLFGQYVRRVEGNRISTSTSRKLELLEDLATWKIPYQTRQQYQDGSKWRLDMLRFKTKHGKDERFYAGEEINLVEPEVPTIAHPPSSWWGGLGPSCGGTKRKNDSEHKQDSPQTVAGPIMPAEHPVAQESSAMDRHVAPRNDPTTTVTPTYSAALGTGLSQQDSPGSAEMERDRRMDKYVKYW